MNKSFTCGLEFSAELHKPIHFGQHISGKLRAVTLPGKSLALLVILEFLRTRQNFHFSGLYTYSGGLNIVLFMLFNLK